MKHVRKFDNYETKINEELSFGGALFFVILKGLEVGYRAISHLVSFSKFTMACKRIEPIYDKIKDDKVMTQLVAKLDEYSASLSFSEEGYEPRTAQRRKEANELIEQIYNRAQELLSPSDFEIFKSAAEDVEKGSGKPAGFFTGAKFNP
jgi:hypothetical protein